MNTKPWYQSKTLWVNAAILASTYVLNHKGVMQQLGLDADLQGILIALANIVLRVGSSTQLTGGKA